MSHNEEFQESKAIGLIIYNFSSNSQFSCKALYNERESEIVGGKGMRMSWKLQIIRLQTDPCQLE